MEYKKAIQGLYNDLVQGAKVYSSNAEDLLRSHRHKLIVARNTLLGSVAVLGACTVAFEFGRFMEEQTESEKKDITTEAEDVIEGFDFVSSARHAEVGRPPTAKIVLRDKSICSVQYSQNQKGILDVPWGAEVTDWGDCPLIED
jgi:hypothetical protein